jgi:tungstate transport system substrate-binding protein
MLVMTPEVAGNGVAGVLARRFTREAQVPVSIVVTEERLVMPLVSEELADVVITTSPQLQRSIQKSGAVRLSNTIAYDDYLLVGPKRDRDRVKDTNVLAYIVRRDRPFCSPVDVPDLHERESMLWAATGTDTERNRRYRQCHGSAAEVLREAGRLNAYTITDRPTFDAARHIDLVPFLERTPVLQNDYTITLLERGRKHRKNAEWFVQWVMSFRGRESVESYRFEGDRRLLVAEP